MPFKTVFLGTAGATPTVERNPPSILLKREGELILLDCGEGTQRQMMKAKTGMSVDKLLITHFHGDHFLGIPGLIQTLAFQGREKPLEIIGPEGLNAVIDQLKFLGANKSQFELITKEIQPKQVIDEEDYVIKAIKADHGLRINSLGYMIKEKQRPGKFDRKKAVELGIEPGPKFSELQKGKTVLNEEDEEIKPNQVLGKPRPGRKLVYTGDTRPIESIKNEAKDADLLIHDATFTEQEKERAKETKHSTAKEAAEVAKEMNTKLLCLFHLSSRYSKNFHPLLNEAKEIFEKTLVPKDFTELTIPYPEKNREIEIDI